MIIDFNAQRHTVMAFFAITNNLQQQLDDICQENGRITDEDIYSILRHNIDYLPSYIDVIELTNPRKNVNGQIIIECTDSFYEYKRNGNRPSNYENCCTDCEEEEACDYPSDEEDDYFIITRTYDSLEDQSNDDYDEY